MLTRCMEPYLVTAMVLQRRNAANETDARLTYDVPEAGRKAGLGRNASYEAVRRGEIPSIKIGGRILVPKARWDRILSGDA